MEVHFRIPTALLLKSFRVNGMNITGCTQEFVMATAEVEDGKFGAFEDGARVTPSWDLNGELHLMELVPDAD